MIFARAIFWPDDVNQENVREDTVFFPMELGRVQTCFVLNQGRAQLFLARKKTTVAILYIQAKLPVKVNLDHLQVSKNLHIEKLT